MNNRRKLIIALGASALAAPIRSFAHQQGEISRIGFPAAKGAVRAGAEVFKELGLI